MEGRLGGYDRAPHKLISELATHNDDAALLLVHRRPTIPAR